MVSPGPKNKGLQVTIKRRDVSERKPAKLHHAMAISRRPRKTTAAITHITKKNNYRKDLCLVRDGARAHARGPSWARALLTAARTAPALQAAMRRASALLRSQRVRPAAKPTKSALRRSGHARRAAAATTAVATATAAESSA